MSQDDDQVFRVYINTENAAFEGDNTGPEIASILRAIADDVERFGPRNVRSRVNDSNGNKVGFYARFKLSEWMIKGQVCT
jgi:hypothetical protein